MKLTPPKKLTFWIAVILGLLGLVAMLVPALSLTNYAFWILFIGFLLLALGLLIKGL